MKLITYFWAFFITISCDYFPQRNSVKREVSMDSAFHTDTIRPDPSLKPPAKIKDRKNSDTSLELALLKMGITSNLLVDYARTLIGTPYKYASIDPLVGFDCSGFITHVFNHFKMKVPRSSKDFDNVGTPVKVDSSKVGDIILFTGTDSTERNIGHMGIIISNDSGIVRFIHSSSGKANGVVITPLNNYYKGRFVKVIRVFK